MSIIITLITGFFIGLIARFIKPGNDNMGLLMTTLVGIGGAFVGSFLSHVFFPASAAEPVGFLGALIGAILLLFILQSLSATKNKA